MEAMDMKRGSFIQKNGTLAGGQRSRRWRMELRRRGAVQILAIDSRTARELEVLGMKKKKKKVERVLVGWMSGLLSGKAQAARWLVDIILGLRMGTRVRSKSLVKATAASF